MRGISRVVFLPTIGSSPCFENRYKVELEQLVSNLAVECFNLNILRCFPGLMKGRSSARCAPPWGASHGS